MIFLEYGIFHEYSKKIVPQQKYQNFGEWNIPLNISGIFQKSITTVGVKFNQGWYGVLGLSAAML